MLGRFLQTITDPEDYLAAIATLQPEPMTQESAEKAQQVYAKYLPHGTEPGHAKLCMAVDLMVGRTEEENAFFAPLGLNAKELHALFAAREILDNKSGGTHPQAQEILEQVQDSTLHLAARVTLARCALDAMAARWDIVEFQEEIAALSGFLTGCGSEAMDKYSDMIREVRLQCLR